MYYYIISARRIVCNSVDIDLPNEKLHELLQQKKSEIMVTPKAAVNSQNV